MPVEILTYAALGTRLKISPVAARSLAKRLRLPRSLSDDGKALVSVDLAEIRHSPRPAGRREAGNVAVAAEIVALHAEIARLEGTAAGHRADFEQVERSPATHLLYAYRGIYPRTWWPQTERPPSSSFPVGLPEPRAARSIDRRTHGVSCRRHGRPARLSPRKRRAATSTIGRRLAVIILP